MGSHLRNTTQIDTHGSVTLYSMPIYFTVFYVAFLECILLSDVAMEDGDVQNKICSFLERYSVIFNGE
jgi:hypothetical protein